MSSFTSTSDIYRHRPAGFVGCLLGSFLAVLIVIGFTNLIVDPSQVFGVSLGDEQHLAEILTHGDDAVVDPSLNMHVVKRELLDRSKSPPQVVAFGSSRVWELSQKMFPNQRFLNAGTNSATLDDYIAMWGLFETGRPKPQTLILEADPWIFNRANPPLTHCMKLAAQFKATAAALGGVSVRRCLDGPPYRKLFSLSSFITSLRFLQWEHDGVGCRGICPVPSDAAMPARSDLWHPDGSMNHFRIEPADSVTAFARDQGETSPRFKFFDGMTVIDTRIVEDWRKLLLRMKANGVSVVVYLSPFHPAYLAAIASHEPHDIELLDEVEATMRRVAQEADIPVIGSYRPDRARCAADEFYDSIHIHPSCIERILATGWGKARVPDTGMSRTSAMAPR